MPQARTRLRQLTQVPGLAAELRTAAAAQLAVLDKAAGERAAPPSAPGNASAAVAAFLSQTDSSAADWVERAKIFPARVRETLLGYALLLNGHFKDAVPVWRGIYQASHPSTDSDARIMLAWALAASGQPAESARLLEHAPSPGRAAEPGLTFLTLAKYAELTKR
jgi:hypothetical protein